MQNNTLLILDIKKNYQFKEKNIKFVMLNRGLINLENCEQIFLKDFAQEKKKIYKKLINQISKSASKNIFQNIPLIEFEINNLRNDRYNFIDRILNFTVLKKIIQRKKIKKIKIISDNENTFSIYKNLNLNIEKIDLSSSEKRLNFFRLRLIKFYLKTFAVLIFLFIFKKKYYPKDYGEFYFSIFPNSFDYNKKKEGRKFANFLLTDETHLNHNLFQIFKNIISLNNKNIVNIENFISLKYLSKLILKTFFLQKIPKQLLENFNIDGLNFNNEIKIFYETSFLNRAKLLIYDEAIPKFLKKFNIKKFHLYLFEYSFGFYLINKIRKFSKSINIIGYQHGIFSNNLFWLDIVAKIKDKKNYIPNKIFASNNYSLEDYKIKFNDKNIDIVNKSKFKKNFFFNKILINKKSKNIIILAGTHDISDLYYFFRNTKKFKDKKIYFKLHPKNKFLIKSIDNIKTVDNLNTKNYSNIIISQTSSLIYHFLKMKIKFFVIDIDYKNDLINSKIRKKTSFISRKNIHDKKVTIKI